MGRKQEKRSKYGVDSLLTLSHHVKNSKHKKDQMKKNVKGLEDMVVDKVNIKKKSKKSKKDFFEGISNENNEWKELNPNDILPVPGDSLIIQKRGGGDIEEVKANVVGIKGNLVTYKIRCPSNSIYNDMSLRDVLEYFNWKYRFNKIVEVNRKKEQNNKDDLMMEN